MCRSFLSVFINYKPTHIDILLYIQFKLIFLLQVVLQNAEKIAT